MAEPARITRLQQDALLCSIYFHPDAHKHLLEQPLVFRGQGWQEFVNVLGEKQAADLAARIEAGADTCPDCNGSGINGTGWTIFGYRPVPCRGCDGKGFC